MSPAKKDPLLTGPQAAERIGLAPATWRSYVRKSLIPPADDPGNEGAPANRSNPRWLTSTVDRFAANRIGQGKRPEAGRTERVARLLGEADASAKRYRAAAKQGAEQALGDQGEQS